MPYDSALIAAEPFFSARSYPLDTEQGHITIVAARNQT